MKSKIVIVGNSGVGKTSLRQRYIKGAFREKQLLTIGVEYASSQERIDDKELKLEIYDIAGQDTFQLQKRLIRNIHGAIIVFDLTRHDSFFNLRGWIEKIYEYNPRSKAPIIIAANKKDLETDREIPGEEIQKLVEILDNERDIYAKNIEYIETSAKTGENIDIVFSTIAKHILSVYY